jgi:hypothetical protein
MEKGGVAASDASSSAPAEAPVTLAAEPSEGTVELTQPDGSPSVVLAKDVDITWKKLEGGKSVRITAKWTNTENWFGVSFPQAGPNPSSHLSTKSFVRTSVP